MTAMTAMTINTPYRKKPSQPSLSSFFEKMDIRLYELISGHRRLAACQVLGFETMPVIVREMSDDEAVIAMVDANL